MSEFPQCLAVFPGHAETMMNDEDLRELLLKTDGWVFLHGRSWIVKSEPAGAGVNSVWLEKR